MTEEKQEDLAHNQTELDEASHSLINDLEHDIARLSSSPPDDQASKIEQFWNEFGIPELRKIANLSKFPSRLQRFRFWIKTSIRTRFHATFGVDR